MRGIAEHTGLASNEARYTRVRNEPLLTTRTIVAHPILRVLVVPYNVSYHLEHHLYPTVPFFRLEALHERLMTEPVFREQAHITHGHRALLRELTQEIAP
jgi:fatty acid desaturase